MKNCYIVNNRFINVKISKLFLFLNNYVTHNCDYLPHTAFLFYLIDCQLNTDFPSNFAFFKIVLLLKDRYLKKMFLKTKLEQFFFFFRKTIDSHKSFSLIEKMSDF